MTTHSQRALILYRRRRFINHLLTYLLNKPRMRHCVGRSSVSVNRLHGAEHQSLHLTIIRQSHSSVTPTTWYRPNLTTNTNHDRSEAAGLNDYISHFVAFRYSCTSPGSHRARSIYRLVRLECSNHLLGTLKPQSNGELGL